MLDINIFLCHPTEEPSAVHLLIPDYTQLMLGTSDFIQIWILSICPDLCQVDAGLLHVYNCSLFKCPLVNPNWSSQTDKQSTWFYTVDIFFVLNPVFPYYHRYQADAVSDGFQFKVPQAQGPGVWDMNRRHGARIVESRERAAAGLSLVTWSGCGPLIGSDCTQCQEQVVRRSGDGGRWPPGSEGVTARSFVIAREL